MDPLVLAILFFLLAGALAAVDLFVPSGGALAVSSLLAAVVSIFFAFRSGATAGLIVLAMMLVAIPIFLTIAIRLWPHTPIGKRVILKTPLDPEASLDPQMSLMQELIGQVGVAQNSLMPYGFVRIGGKNYNACCDGGIVEAGQNVQVIGVQHRNLLVAYTTLAPTIPPASAIGQAPAGQALAGQAPAGQLEPKPLGESLLDRPAGELGLDSLD